MIVPVRPASRATAMGGGVPAAQPGGGDHRRGDRGADGRGQRVRAPDQDRLPLDLRVPEPRALLGVPVDPLLHRVDVDERQHFPAGQQRRLPRQARQEPPARLLQLGDVPPGVRAQMRAERGRRPDPAEQRAHRAVPQHVHVIDAVRARGHARDQGRHLQCALTPHSWPGRTCSATRPGSPARPASAITGTSPACDTRFGSSNSALILASACNNCTYKVSSRTGNWKLRQLPFSQLRGHLSR
jgi:hypothetical protein